MEFLENALSKAKDAIDIAVKKTGEVVTTEKQRFDASALKNKREKDYAMLGKLWFEQIKDSDDISEEAKQIVTDIKQKTAEIDRINGEIASAKNKRICPSCGAGIAENAVFCSTCGAKLTVEN